MNGTDTEIRTHRHTHVYTYVASWAGLRCSLSFCCLLILSCRSPNVYTLFLAVLSLSVSLSFEISPLSHSLPLNPLSLSHFLSSRMVLLSLSSCLHSCFFLLHLCALWTVYSYVIHFIYYKFLSIIRLKKHDLNMALLSVVC